MTEPREHTKPATSTGGRPPIKPTTESLNRFNYYGRVNTHSGIGGMDMNMEDDVEREFEKLMNRELGKTHDLVGPSLERRIEEVMKMSNARPQPDQYVLSMASKINKNRNMTAGVDAIRRKRMPKSGSLGGSVGGNYQLPMSQQRFTQIKTAGGLF